MRQQYLLIVLLMLTGCSSQERNSGQDLMMINVPQHSGKHEVKLSSFVGSLSYIPLETKDECLIGSVDKIVVTDDYYYVMDKYKAGAVFCFDKSGKFFRKIGNVGGAPGEYTRVSDVNVYKDKIYVWDLASTKMFIYDLDGHFLKEMQIFYLAENFSVLDDSWIAFFCAYRNAVQYNGQESCPNLLFYNMDTGELVPDLFYNTKIKSHGILSCPGYFPGDGSLVIPFNDTIYQVVSPTVLKRKYVMKFDDKYVKARAAHFEKLLSEDVVLFNFEDFEKVPWVLSYIETPSYSFIYYILEGNSYWGIIDHKQPDTYIEASDYRKNPVINDIDGVDLFMPYSSYKNVVYSHILPENIASDEGRWKDLKIDDNPVIVKMELK